ncbi:MAG: NAD-dependent epimerase/dehydratase family protein [Phycisphaerae bacterium]|nr:NAD-dependent epimerase/dehydratase family protein [Phycisphaerae bacterium]
MRPTLVTGSAGFIGSHVVAALLARGRAVVGLDNFDPFYAEAIKRQNARDAGAHELVEADLTDPDAVRAALARHRPETIIHLAGKAGVRPSLADPAGYARANVVATAVLLAEAARAGCRRVVLASSSSVYGNNRKTPFAEDDPVDAPISPYAATKKACELVAHAHHAATRMPVACLRFFTVFGPRQRPDLAIHAFMSRIARGEPIAVFGDGSMARDYTYIDDIVTGVLAAADRIDDHGYRVWNLGSDRPVRLDAMIAAIARTVGREPIIDRKPVPTGDVERTWADLARARAELDYAPTTPFEEGLGRQWDWMRGRL